MGKRLRSLLRHRQPGVGCRRDGGCGTSSFPHGDRASAAVLLVVNGLGFVVRCLISVRGGGVFSRRRNRRYLTVRGGAVLDRSFSLAPVLDPSV